MRSLSDHTVNGSCVDGEATANGVEGRAVPADPLATPLLMPLSTKDSALPSRKAGEAERPERTMTESENGTNGGATAAGTPPSQDALSAVLTSHLYSCLERAVEWPNHGLFRFCAFCGEDKSPTKTVGDEMREDGSDTPAPPRVAGRASECCGATTTTTNNNSHCVNVITAVPMLLDSSPLSRLADEDRCSACEMSSSLCFSRSSSAAALSDTASTATTAAAVGLVVAATKMSALRERKNAAALSALSRLLMLERG